MLNDERLKLPLKIANLIIGTGSIILIILIVGLFLLQPKSGTPATSSIQTFEENADEYFNEDESYKQINDNIRTYQASGRPDKKGA